MGCLRRIFLLVFLGVAAWAGWRWGGHVFPGVERWVRDTVETRRAGSDPGGAPDPRLADEAMERYHALVAGQATDSIMLAGDEVASTLRYAVPEALPPGLTDPRIRFEEGRAVVQLSVALSSFPRFPEMEGLLEILPDTVPLELRGGLEPLGGGEVALRIDQAEASRIPVPRRLHPRILEALGRQDRPGLAPEAVAVPLPPGVSSAYIAGDRLVLLVTRQGS